MVNNRIHTEEQDQLCRVLFVDDDAIDRLAFERFAVEEQFCEFRTAGSIAAAKDLLGRESFNVLIVDHSLSDGTAFDLFHYKDRLPIILITGMGDEELAVKALKEGASDYHIKDNQGSYLQTLPVSIEHAIVRFREHQELLQYRSHLEQLVEERTRELHAEIESHKITEAKVSTARDFYLTLFEKFPAMIWQTGIDKHFNYFNSTWLSFTGRTLEEEKAFGWIDGVHPADREKFKSVYDEAFEKRETFSIEIRVKNQAGKYRWLISYGRPFEDLEGEFAGYIGACYDISGRKENEKKIIKVQNILQVINHSSSTLMTGRNEMAIINVICRNVLEHTSYETVAGGLFTSDGSLELAEFAAPELTVNCKQELQQYLAEMLFPRNDEPAMIQNDGRLLIPELTQKVGEAGYKELAKHCNHETLLALPLRYDDLPVGVLCIFSKAQDDFLDDEIRLFEELARNVSYALGLLRNKRRRKVSQKKLAKSRYLLKEISNNSPVFIYLVDVQKRELVFMNHSLLHYLNLKLDDTRDSLEEIISVMHEEDRPKLQARLATLSDIHNDKLTEIQFRINNADGNTIWFEGREKVFSRDKNGDVKLTIGMLDDVTQKVRSAEELMEAKKSAEESSKLKSALLMNLSHEFRTPMTGILGYAAQLDGIESISEVERMADKILFSGRRLMSTLNSVLELAHLTSVDAAVETENIDAMLLLKHICSKYEARVREQGLTLTFDCGLASLRVQGVSHMLEQIIENLLDNALKYTEEGGITVSCYVRPEDRYYGCIEIRDTGIGIDPKYHNVIFEEFRQVSEGYGRAYEGTGLGLALAKKMTELMDGAIEVVSNAGEGAAFIIKLPFSGVEEHVITPAIETANVAESADEQKSQQRKYLLLVEDNEINRELIHIYLEGSFIVDTAADAKEALEMAARRKYDIVLMDINLGYGMNGVDAAKKMREDEHYRNIPFVAVTGYATEQDRINILEEGFEYHLPKPFEREQILESVKAVLSPQPGVH